MRNIIFVARSHGLPIFHKRRGETDGYPRFQPIVGSKGFTPPVGIIAIKVSVPLRSGDWMISRIFKTVETKFVPAIAQPGSLWKDIFIGALL
jgi:hypothetical protein